eukprot:scaffold12417_cov22-Cyclotella_meneghiniana.AAC.1
MDFLELTSFVEKRLKKFTDLTLASSCNLTTASKYKLEGALQVLIRCLKKSLIGSSLDLDRVKDTIRTFDYLEQFIDDPCVHSAAERGKEMIVAHVERTKSVIEDQVERGLKSDIEFSTENILIVNESLLLLVQLDNSFSSEQWHSHNERRLVEFKDRMLQKISALDLASFHSELKTLSIWADQFGCYSNLYAEACTAISEYFRVISIKISKTDVSKLDEGSHDEIVGFVKSYSVLNDFCERVVHFSVKDIAIDSLIHERDLVTNKMLDLFEAWVSDVAALLERDLAVLIQDSDAFDQIARRVESTETIKDVLNVQTFDCYRLLNKTEEAKKQVECFVTEWYISICDNLKASTFNSVWSSSLIFMRDVGMRFAEMNGVTWKEIQPAYRSLLEKIKLSIVDMGRELLSRSEAAFKDGINNGKGMARDLLHLQSCNWVDLLGSDIISSYCSKVESAIDARIQAKSSQLESLINSLDENVSQGCDSIETLGHILPELREIDNYLANFKPQNDLPGLSRKCITRLEQHVNVLNERAFKFVKRWDDGIALGKSNDIRCTGRVLNGILSRLQYLKSTDASDDLMRSSDLIISLIHETLQKCTITVTEEFELFKGDFQKRAALLSSIQACQEFAHVSKRLPEFDKLKHDVRHLISVEAQQIEELLECSSEWETIDGRLEIFESACLLDAFTDEEAHHRLGTLRRMREQKESKVDEVLHAMIRQQDFQQIAQFLSPLASSKDQLQKHKFSVYQKEIAVSLEEMIHRINRLLDAKSSLFEENSQEISKTLDLIECAKCDLQELLYPRLNLSEELKILSTKVNSILTKSFVGAMFDAIKSDDFIQLIAVRHHADGFHLHMQKHFDDRSIKAFEAAQAKAFAKLESVSTHVELFFKSSFTEVKGLVSLMTSLRESKEHQEDYFAVLHNLYNTTKADIDHRAREAMQQLENDAEEDKMYDDAISLVHALNRYLQGPLKNHCSSNLQTECNRLLDALREGKQKSDEWLNFDVKKLAPKIQEISSKLDKLQGGVWDRLNPFSKKEKAYKSHQRQLGQLVDKRFGDAEAAIKNKDARE